MKKDGLFRRLLKKNGVQPGSVESELSGEKEEMIRGVFTLSETTVKEVMVPRIDVAFVSLAMNRDEVMEKVADSGHSRLPVYRDTIDNVVGMLYAKDLLPYLRQGRSDVPLKNILRQAYFIPETKKASDLLPDLQQRRVHMAVVVDEYGGVAGLVTIEDLLEEIVGEIQDEYDVEEPYVEFVSDTEYVFDARVDLDDLNRLMDVSLPTGDSDTLGGFIYTELGKVPTVGDQVAFDNMDFTVESVAGRRIKKVRVEVRPQAVVEESREEENGPFFWRNGNGNGKAH